MYKRPKIGKYQQPEMGEKKTDSIPPRASSFAQSAQFVASSESSQLLDPEELESVKPLVEHQEASGTHPPSHPKLSPPRTQSYGRLDGSTNKKLGNLAPMIK